MSTRNALHTLLVLVISALPAAVGAAEPSPPPDLADRYREPAARISGAALHSRNAYDNLAWLCDRIGHRLSGSENLERAVEWAVGQMKADGLENVRTEPVTVPRWVRGREGAWMTAPRRRDLSILGLGMSVATPPEGIEAEIVVVRTFAALDSLGQAGVSGKIVLFDAPFTTYGKTSDFRTKGASRAAGLGAVAVLVRSVGPVSLSTPHTGSVTYDEKLPKIPAAAVTIEDATFLARLRAAGETVRVHLEMEAKLLDPVTSHNVIGEIRGSERPEEIVIVGGHLDSWDVGQGAQDDGVGCVIAMDTVRLLKDLGLQPRRTVRVILYTNEENGVAGGKAYRDRHRSELDRHVAAIESDSGNGPVSGFSLEVKGVAGEGDSLRTHAEAVMARETALRILAPISELLAPLEAGVFGSGGSGADLGPIVELGVAGLGVRHDTSRYFDIHHTHADTFDKVDARVLAKNLAAVAVLTYVLADMPGRLIEPAGAAASGSR